MIKNKTMKLLTSSAVIATMFALPQTASAVAFTGQLDYVGAQTTNVADLTVATQATILFANVAVQSGAFSVIPLGALLVHTSPLVFRPVAGTPYTPLWTHAASGISFDLTSLSIGPGNTATSLTLNGSGTFYCTSLPCTYDATPGIWNMTINNAGGVTGSFSSSSTATPEPGTLALLGLGLIGLAAARRRKA